MDGTYGGVPNPAALLTDRGTGTRTKYRPREGARRGGGLCRFRTDPGAGPAWEQAATRGTAGFRQKLAFRITDLKT